MPISAAGVGRNVAGRTGLIARLGGGHLFKAASLNLLIRNIFGLTVAALFLGACSRTDFSEDFADEMPSVAQIQSKMATGDPIESQVRQARAALYMNTVVATLSGYRWGKRQLTPEEVALNNEYSRYFNDYSRQYMASRVENPAKRSRMDTAAALLGADFDKEVREKLLPGSLQRRFEKNEANGTYSRARPGLTSIPWGWIISIAVGIWLFRKFRKPGSKLAENNRKALAVFGATMEERERAIDEAFDKRDQTLYFNLDAKDRGWNFVAICQISRSISAMSPKEREALRSVYHLYNSGMNNGDINTYIQRLGIIWADGKGTVVGKTEMRGLAPGDVPDIRGAIDKYLAEKLESALNMSLADLGNATSNNPGHPLLKSLAARLFGTGADLAPNGPLKPLLNGATPPAGLILGLDEQDGSKKWYYDGEGSLLTVAPPGSGKTQCHVFPNLLQWRGPAVILDVKGEIYAQTSKWRTENVGPVFRFNPLDPAHSHCYNPLTVVRSDREFLWEDARFLSDMMIVPTGAKDPFWENRARDVVTAAIARVCVHDPAERPMADVMDILHGVGWDKFVAYLEARSDFRSMSRAGHSLAGMDPKTRDGVLQQALSSMSAWDGERITRATAKSDWSPLDLRGGANPTIYICLRPNEVESYISVLRVLIAQHIRVLTTELPPREAHPILFLLDELPRLRQMPPVEEALEIGRQYGIRLWMFTQSLGQLENAYPNAEGMVGGCAVRMFMNPSLHDETAQKISDDIGFKESVIDGTRVKVVEPNVLAGPDFKDTVIVMAAHANAARLRKNFAYADASLTARMGSL